MFDLWPCLTFFATPFLAASLEPALFGRRTTALPYSLEEL